MSRTLAPPPDSSAVASREDATAAPAGAAAVAPVLRWHWVALVGVLLLAAGLRICHLTYDSFWIDELYSVEYTTGVGCADFAFPRNQLIDPAPRVTQLTADKPSPLAVWSCLGADCHPPLHYFVLRLWRDAFGSSERSCRFLSVVASLVAIGLLFDVGRVLVNPRVALWAALLMALSQPQIWYAQEARGYTLLAACFIGAAAALVRIERLGWNRRRAAGLFAGLLGAALTHYYAAPACLALGAYALVRLRGPARTRTVLVMAAAGATWLVIWGPFFATQLHTMGSHETWLADHDPGFFGRWVHRLLVAPIRLLARPLPDSEGFGRWMAILLVVPFFFVRRRRELLLPALWAVTWITLPAALDLARTTIQLNQVRYYLTTGPAVYLLGAALMTGQRRKWDVHLIPAAMALYCLIMMPWTYASHKADWRAFGHAAADYVRPGDVVLFHTPYNGPWFAGVQYVALDYYAPGVATRVCFLDGDQPAGPDVADAARSARAVWLATDPAVTDADVARHLPGYVMAEYWLAPDVGKLARLWPTSATRPSAASSEGQQP